MPACSGCHSPDGAGIPAQYPRLAGQHAEYTVAQLKAFRSGERANDPNKMMRMIAAKLTDREIQALAEYIAGAALIPRAANVGDSPVTSRYELGQTGAAP